MKCCCRRPMPTRSISASEKSIRPTPAKTSCRISRVSQLDTEVSAQEAIVTAEIEMKVLTPFAVCSPIASNCTGTCWDLQSGQPKLSVTGRQSLPIAYRIRIEKSFAFRKSKERRLVLRHGRTAAGRIRPRAERAVAKAQQIRFALTRCNCCGASGMPMRTAFRLTKKATRRIFSFAFRIARLIDAVVLTSIPSTLEPLEFTLGGRDDVFAAR